MPFHKSKIGSNIMRFVFNSYFWTPFSYWSFFLFPGAFHHESILFKTVGLYLHFATSVIHEITTALGIYCFRLGNFPAVNVLTFCDSTARFECCVLFGLTYRITRKEAWERLWRAVLSARLYCWLFFTESRATWHSICVPYKMVPQSIKSVLVGNAV